ncbi:hypothetical protein [Nisaea sediminum]|nr:hypothetical protein [Nisaea sediminum]
MSEERNDTPPPIKRRGEFIMSGEVGRWQLLGRLIAALWRKLRPNTDSKG